MKNHLEKRARRTSASGLPRLALAIATAVGMAALLAVGEPAAPSPHMTDAEIEAVLRVACSRMHPIDDYRAGEKYSSYGARGGKPFEMIGPLWLADRSDERARGVILTPFLRLYLAGRWQRCKRLDVEYVRELAGPETWVVLWRTEDPPTPLFRMFTTSDQRVLRPIKVRNYAGGRWQEPLWTENRNRWVRAWFSTEWDEKESLLAAFPHIDKKGRLNVDYQIDEDGRKCLTESVEFPFWVVPDKWWDAAHGRDPDRTP